MFAVGSMEFRSLLKRLGALPPLSFAMALRAILESVICIEKFEIGRSVVKNKVRNAGGCLTNFLSTA